MTLPRTAATAATAALSMPALVQAMGPPNPLPLCDIGGGRGGGALAALVAAGGSPVPYYYKALVTCDERWCISLKDFPVINIFQLFDYSLCNKTAVEAFCPANAPFQKIDKVCGDPASNGRNGFTEIFYDGEDCMPISCSLLEDWAQKDMLAMGKFRR